MGREGFRFTKLVFGLTQSPFVLEATLFQNTSFFKIRPISKYGEVYKKIVEEITASMYFDDLISGGYKMEEVTEL